MSCLNLCSRWQAHRTRDEGLPAYATKDRGGVPGETCPPLFLLLFIVSKSWAALSGSHHSEMTLLIGVFAPVHPRLHHAVSCTPLLRRRVLLSFSLSGFIAAPLLRLIFRRRFICSLIFGFGLSPALSGAEITCPACSSSSPPPLILLFSSFR